MRYIKKSEQPPSQFEMWKETNAAEIDKKCREYEENTKTTSSDIVWKLLKQPLKDKEMNARFLEALSEGKEFIFFSNEDLRLILLREQGYICAYCGRRILNNIHVKLDHVDPKSIKIRRTFDYYNIVAACSGGKYKWHQVQKGETLESIAEMYGTTPKTIKDLNPSQKFEEDTRIIKEDTRIEILFGLIQEIAVAVQFKHCDTKKGDKEHPIKPTDSDCQTKFMYSQDGKIWGIDNDAKTTIGVLGLNDNPSLIQERETIYRNFKQIETVIKAPYLSNKQKREYLIKAKSNSIGDELEEMVFVKEFFWKTLPISL